VQHVIQVEPRTDTTHTLTWLDAALKPKPGMVPRGKDDPRPWTVAHAYKHHGSGNGRHSHGLVQRGTAAGDPRARRG
jgi:hypothetical protein